MIVGFLQGIPSRFGGGNSRFRGPIGCKAAPRHTSRAESLGRGIGAPGQDDTPGTTRNREEAP